MNYRNVILLDEKTLGASGTEIIPITPKTPISRISMRVELLGFAAVYDAHPAATVTKIELVDGSDVLHSLSGRQSQALCIYDRRAPSMTGGTYFAGGTVRTDFGIDFGRYLWDKELAFDPAKFDNPVLKVTYNRALCQAGCTAMRLEVSAWCFDEKVISPIGFLLSKEHYVYTISTDGSFENISMPLDYPYRHLLIRGYYADREPTHALESMRLDEDRLARIPFDVNLNEYYELMRSIWPLISERLAFTAWADDFTFYVTPTDYFAFNINSLAGHATGYTKAYTRGGQVKMNCAGGLQMEQWGWVHGYLPHHCFDFVFGDPNDLDDLYDVTKLGHLNLRLEAGDGGGTTGEVAIQQLRRY